MRAGIGSPRILPGTFVTNISGVNTYKLCDQKWEFERVENRVRPIEGPHYFKTGTVGHDAVRDHGTPMPHLESLMRRLTSFSASVKTVLISSPRKILLSEKSLLTGWSKPSPSMPSDTKMSHGKPRSQLSSHSTLRSKTTNLNSCSLDENFPSSD